MKMMLRAFCAVLLAVCMMALPKPTEAQSAAPSFSKVFSPDTIGPGGTSTLTFTITNNTASPVSDLDFTDVLPAVPGAMTISPAPNASTTCTGGTLSAPAGGTTISYTGGAVGGGTSCTVSVNVTASTVGTHTNVSGNLTSSAGNSGTASDDLTVSASAPGFTKSFAPPTIPLGARSTLTFLIDNSANASVASNLDFTDNLPGGMVVASPANAATTCGTAVVPPTLTATAGSSQIILDANGTVAFPAVAAGATCTVTVDVTGVAVGTHANSTELLADFSSAGFAAAALIVTGGDQLQITKSFTDDPVAPGGTATLEFTLTNNNRAFPAQDVAFTDDLNAMLTGATFGGMATVNTCGGSGGGTGTFSYSGATIAPEASCTIRIPVNIPGGAAPGSYPNVTTAITGTIDGSAVTGGTASDSLTVGAAQQLQFTKQFLAAGTLTPNPVVSPGDDVVIRYTITNPNAGSGATDITFSDEMTDEFSFPLIVASPAIPNPPCGAGSAAAVVFVDTDREAVALTGGNLAASGAGDTCTFDITLTIPGDQPGGTVFSAANTLSATINGSTVTTMGASASLTVNAGVNVSFSKAFTDDPVVAGNTATLEFTISNAAESSGDATAISFTDDLAALSPVLAGVTFTLPPNPDPACGASSTVTGSAGDTLLTFQGGTLSPGASCTFSVTLNVPGGAATGSHANTTSALSFTGAGQALTVPAASDTLEVQAANEQPLIFTKEFLENPYLPGQAGTLRYTVENPNAADATITFFTDSLSTALTGLAATGPATSDTCGGTLAGTTFLTYVGGSVLAGQTCTIDVPILVPLAAVSGNYANPTSSLAATVGATPVITDPVTAALEVFADPVILTHTVLTPAIAPGGTGQVEFVLTNSNPGTVTNATFSIDYGAVIPGAVGAPTSISGCSAGGSISTGSVVSATGLNFDTFCRFIVNLTIPGGAAENTYNIATSGFTGTIGSSPITAAAASASYNISSTVPPTFTKAFAGSVFPGQVASLSFTIDNSASAAALSELSFTDDFDAMLSGATLAGVTSNSCGGTVAGTGFLTFSGGSVAAGASCVLTVAVQVPVGTAGGSYPNTTSALRSQGLTLAPAATASLVVDPVFAPGFAKVFAPDVVDQGAVSTMRFTIDNTANGLAGTDLAFTDNFPAGLEVADPSNRNNSCGGTFTATAGATNVSLTGGSVVAGDSCIIEVDVRAAGAGALVNTTSDLTSSSLPTAAAASATLTSNAATAPGFAKAFAPNVVDQGVVSTMSFTIDNSANAIAGADLAFTDAFPAGLEVADPANLDNGCGGTFTATAGATDVSLSGGALPAGNTCIIEVDVRAAGAGALVNTTSNLTSSSLPTAVAASATLTSNAATAPGFAKVFAPDVISQGEITTLSFTIDNAANAIEATDLAFDDPLPAGLVVASPAAVSNSCGGTVTAAPGAASLGLASGTVAASASCTVSVNVQGLVAGVFDNVTSTLSTSLGQSAAASDQLTVNALPLSVSMGFAPGTIEQNDTAVLSYTLTNAAQIAATGVSLTDSLPADLVLASPASPGNSCGGSLTAADGGSAVSLTGGTVAAGGSCTVSVTVTSGVVGDYANSTETVSSSLGTSAAASATLTVERATTGTLTIVQNTDTDGAYAFSSATGALNFTINTAGGTGSRGPITVPTGTHVVLQATPDGVGNTAITCNDDDSAGQPQQRTLTVSIDPLETVICTFTSVSSRQKTVDTINRFLTKRADLILSSEPSSRRRFDRLNRGMGGATPLSFAKGDLNSFLPFTAQVSAASNSYSLSTSFLQMREAAASLALAHGDQRGIRHIPNYRWDAWFEAQYKTFDAGPDNGHFAIAYFGADYLVTPDLLVGALLQIDDMDDSSAALNSSVSGTGWMAGPYMTARIGPNLYFDGRVAAGTSRNDISPFNTYIDEFTTERWMAMAGVTGEFQQGNWTIQPGASLSYFEEKQFSYVDSVGVVIPSQVVSLGQVKVGPTFSGQFQTSDGTDYMPYISLDALYNFGDTKGVTVTNADTASTDGWRGRVQAGIDFRFNNGGSVSIGGSYDGIGRGSLESWGANLKFEFPLQKATAQ